MLNGLELEPITPYVKSLRNLQQEKLLGLPGTDSKSAFGHFLGQVDLLGGSCHFETTSDWVTAETTSDWVTALLTVGGTSIKPVGRTIHRVISPGAVKSHEPPSIIPY